MTPEELRASLTEVGYTNLRQASEALGMKRRTLEDYAYGVTGIPQATADHIRAFCRGWKEYWPTWREEAEKRIDREFPNGIR
jgi:hypothetical protein